MPDWMNANQMGAICENEEAFISFVHGILQRMRLHAAPDFLVASHARPWKGATNAERLDGDNGLPLLPNLDKLFDKGFITFEDDGTIRISSALPPNAYGPMGVDPTMTLVKPLNPAQKGYLKYHRNHVFKGA